MVKRTSWPVSLLLTFVIGVLVQGFASDAMAVGDDTTGYVYDDAGELAQSMAGAADRGGPLLTPGAVRASDADGPLMRQPPDSVAPTSAVDDLLSAACRKNSFVPGTEVLMADGSTKLIEDVEIGDYVWAADPETGGSGPRQVIYTIVGDGHKQLVDIEVLGDTVTATDGHPFWVDDEGRWVEAGDLEAGDHLLLADGSSVLMSAASERLAVGRVHNLTVEGIHTYFVKAGDDAVLVHNCTIGDKIRGQMTDRGWTDDLVSEMVDNPTVTHNVWDLTTDSAATAYARGDNFYVVVNDATGEVIQISNRNRPGWTPVWNDPKFDPPG